MDWTTSPVTVLTDRLSIQDALHGLAEWSEWLHLAFAWASSDGGKADHWQMLPYAKIKRAVLGVQFAHTEPFVLRELQHLGVLRVTRERGAGIFHPKVILGTRGIEACAIVGSSNFTAGGFDSNTELNIFLSGKRDAQPLASVLRFIDEQWRDAEAPQTGWIDWYDERYRTRPKPLHINGPMTTNISTMEQLNIEWDDFVEMISNQHMRRLPNGSRIPVFDDPEGSYLQEVESCQRSFRASASFETMPLDDRKLVAGWGNQTKGWFGSMRAAGEFKNITAERPHDLSIALDHVPLDGDVTLANTRDYLKAALGLSGVGLGAATRLLTMKRPDRFLSTNNASLQKMSTVYGIIANKLDNYLRIIEETWKFPWANAARPTTVIAQRIWQTRVGLLDTIFYEPSVSRDDG